MGLNPMFLLIQLKPKCHCLDVFNYSLHSVCMSGYFLSYLLTYLGVKRFVGAPTSTGELMKGQNIHKSGQQQCLLDVIAVLFDRV